MGKPRLLLLDANIVIEAYELGLWEQLTKAVSITLPSIVMNREANYFTDSRTGSQIPIHLDELVDNHVIECLSATAQEMAYVLSQFDSVFVEGIDPGEQEAIALMVAGHLPEHFFCSADGAAIEALAMLGLSEQGVAFETVLSSHGLRKTLAYHYGVRYFQEHILKGQQNRITGFGLAAGSRYRL